MITAGDDQLPNPYKSSVRDILGALVCHDNAHRRLSVEIRELKNELKEEIRKLEISCSQVKRPICKDSKPIKDFDEHLSSIDKVKQCFTGRVEDLETARQEVLEQAKQCLEQLNAEKCKLKQFHEKTVEHLKRTVINSTDAAVIKSCEKDICEMNKRFIKEVAFIKSSENTLLPFFRQLHETDLKMFYNCCCFKNYEWAPQGKSLAAVEEVSNSIKNTMGNTLGQAFAQLYIHRPADPKSFLAAYLMNLAHNEEVVKKKMNLFGDA